MGNGINGIGNGAPASLANDLLTDSTSANSGKGKANSVNANANTDSTNKPLSLRESRKQARQERRAERHAQRAAAKKAGNAAADSARVDAKQARKAARVAARQASKGRRSAKRVAMNRDTVKLSVRGTSTRSQGLQAEASKPDVVTSKSDPAQNDYSSMKTTFKASLSPNFVDSNNASFGVTNPTTALHTPTSGVNFAPADKGSANGSVLSAPTSAAGAGDNGFTGSLNPPVDPSRNNLGQPQKGLGAAPKNGNGLGQGLGQGPVKGPGIGNKPSPGLGNKPGQGIGNGPGQGKGKGNINYSGEDPTGGVFKGTMEAFKGQLNSFYEKGPEKSEGPKGPGNNEGSGKGEGPGKGKGYGKWQSSGGGYANAKAAQPANKPYKFAERGPSPAQLLRYSGNLTQSVTRGPVNMNALKLNVEGADTAPAASASGRVSIKLDDNYLETLSRMKAVTGGNQASSTNEKLRIPSVQESMAQLSKFHRDAFGGQDAIFTDRPSFSISG